MIVFLKKILSLIIVLAFVLISTKALAGAYCVDDTSDPGAGVDRKSVV